MKYTISYFSNKLVSFLIKSSGKVCDINDYKIYVYGMECFLNNLFTFTLLAIWGFLFHNLLEIALWAIAFLFLRHYCGGSHASSQCRCILSTSALGSSTTFVVLLFQKYLSNSFPIWIILFFLLCLYAPAPSKKVFLSRQEKLKKKIFSLLLLLCGYLFSCFFQNHFGYAVIYGNICAILLMATAHFQSE